MVCMKIKTHYVIFQQSHRVTVIIQEVMFSIKVQIFIKLNRFKNLSKMNYLKKLVRVDPEGDSLSKYPEIKSKLLQTATLESQIIVFIGNDKAGKISATQFIEKNLNKEIFTIDLAMVVSKYIGETEKNLNSIFEEANGKVAILYFDEAEALLGKRTDVRDSHDRYARVQISDLLKQFKSYKGIVILSFNENNDLVYKIARESRSVFHFPNPKP